MFLGNLALIQVQGLVIGALSGVFSFLLGIIVNETVESFEQTMLLICCAMFTASISSLIMGSLLCLIVWASRVFKVNPDNISTPLAASLGDLVTLGLLSLSAVLLRYLGEIIYLLRS